MMATQYRGIWVVGFALLLLGLMVHPALAQQDSPYTRGVLTTVTAIDEDAGVATLQTESGQVFQVHQRLRWEKGDKVMCDQRNRSGRLELQNCRLWSYSLSHMTLHFLHDLIVLLFYSSGSSISSCQYRSSSSRIAVIAAWHVAGVTLANPSSRWLRSPAIV